VLRFPARTQSPETLPAIFGRHPTTMTMTKIRHRFIDHQINPKTEILVMGTFNPDTEENIADFFYGRQRNFLWTLIPTALGEASLKGKSKDEKLKFIERFKIDFIDLISEVEVNEAANYDDGYIDSKVSEWRNVIAELNKLQNLKKICFTRKSFGDIPNMKARIDEIESYCEQRKIPLQLLTTPARFYRQDKQTEWTKFFNYDNR
jgi:G:T/U-mismatch repair DNA glycosylase